MFTLFKNCGPIIGLVGLAHSSSFSSAYCSYENKLSFDTRGFESKITCPYTNDNLTLTGIGMRKMNIFITELHVYLVGIHLNDKALERVKSWKMEKSEELLSTILLPVLSEESSYFPFSNNVKKNESPVSIKLRFVRNVNKEKIVDAFSRAFKGLSKEAVTDFQSALNKALGDNGFVSGPIPAYKNRGKSAFKVNDNFFK